MSSPPSVAIRTRHRRHRRRCQRPRRLRARTPPGGAARHLGRHRHGDGRGARLTRCATTARFSEASLLVLGPTHRRSLARTLRGTARRLLSQAPCPVAVAPAGSRHRPERRSATSASASSRRPRAPRRSPWRTGSRRAPAAPCGPSASRCRCRRSPSTTFATASRISRTSAASSKPGSSARWRSCPRRFRRPPTRAWATPPSSWPRRRASSTSWCAARAGRGPLRAVLLGSVTERLLRSAACPVVIVPRPTGQPRRRRRTMPSAVLPPPRG